MLLQITVLTMDLGVKQKKIIGMLDILANGLADFRTEFDGFRNEMYGFRNEMYDFRKETSANFTRLQRRLDNHETRIEDLEQRVTHRES